MSSGIRAVTPSKFWDLEIMPELAVSEDFFYQDEQQSKVLLDKIAEKIARLYASYFTKQGLEKYSLYFKITTSTIVAEEDLPSLIIDFKKAIIDKIEEQYDFAKRCRQVREIDLRITNRDYTSGVLGEAAWQRTDKYPQIGASLVFDEKRSLSLTLNYEQRKYHVSISDPYNKTVISLNPCEKKFAEEFKLARKSASSTTVDDATIEELRESTKVFLPYSGALEDVPIVDKSVAARDGYKVPIRIFNPDAQKSAAVLFFPGNAYIFDLFEMNSIICSRIAKLTGSKVILINTRLAPEHPMPKSVDDGYDVAAYIAGHATSFKTLILAGWCSGAHCAAAISSQVSKNKLFNIHHQILISGFYDLTGSLRGFEEYEQQDQLFHRHTLNRIIDRFYGITHTSNQVPFLSPFHQSDCAGLPSTTLICGEFDGLRGDTEWYAKKLEQAGVYTKKIILPGQTHNTIALRPVLSEGQDPAEAAATIINSYNNCR